MNEKLKTAQDFMACGLDAIRDRAALRDKPTGERSMARAVAAFNALFETTLTETQGWQFQAVLKAARSAEGAFHADDYVDQSSYSALAGESAVRAACATRRSVDPEILMEGDATHGTSQNGQKR